MASSSIVASSITGVESSVRSTADSESGTDVSSSSAADDDFGACGRTDGRCSEGLGGLDSSLESVATSCFGDFGLLSIGFGGFGVLLFGFGGFGLLPFCFGDFVDLFGIGGVDF